MILSHLFPNHLHLNLLLNQRVNQRVKHHLKVKILQFYQKKVQNLKVQVKVHLKNKKKQSQVLVR